MARLQICRYLSRHWDPLRRHIVAERQRTHLGTRQGESTFFTLSSPANADISSYLRILETTPPKSTRFESIRQQLDNTSTVTPRISSACSVCTRHWREVKVMSSRPKTSGTRFKLNVPTLRNCWQSRTGTLIARAK